MIWSLVRRRLKKKEMRGGNALAIRHEYCINGIIMETGRQTVFSFSAYGLNISSDVPCPAPRAIIGPPDVHVQYGQVAESIEAPLLETDLYQLTPGCLLLKIDGVGRFLVEDGRRVLVDRDPLATDSDLWDYVIGNVLGAILHQRGALPLHASAVSKDGWGAIFMGASGSGKTTLAAAFRQKGYSVIADDISVVEISDKATPLLRSGFPQLRLCPDAAMKLGVDAVDSIRKSAEVHKLDLLCPDQFRSGAVPLAAIYLLKERPGEQVSLTPLTGRDKLMALIDNTYGLALVQGPQRRLDHFAQCAALARTTPVTSIQRPRLPFLLDELAAEVERDLCGVLKNESTGRVASGNYSWAGSRDNKLKE
jgi:hypothetical protein